MKKAFIFTIDDNIRFLQEATQTNCESIFYHPYMKILKELHEKFGVKVQLNLFYTNESFTLCQMSDKYKKEWSNNSHWLKLSFHSRKEHDCSYQNASYEEVFEDCNQVNNEILRFAGEDSLAKTTTIHSCRATKEGVRSLKDSNVSGLLGLFGTDEKPRESYSLSEVIGKKMREGELLKVDNVVFSGIDVVLNCFTIPQILEQLCTLKERKLIKVMIHEQYFYFDYPLYQKDFKEKLERTFAYLEDQGFVSLFFEDVINKKEFFA